MTQLAAFLHGLGEADLRRQCGTAVFARADLLQRAGHVIDPEAGEAGLRATVRGTWRRLDQVRVRESRGKPSATCSCGSAGLCRHAAALLLQWVRDQSSFAVGEVPDEEEAPSTHPAARSAVESHEQELARHLEADSMQQLREIAAMRGLKAGGRGKANLIASLAPLLAEPSGVDRTVSGLAPDERLALDALHLLGSIGPAGAEQVAVAYRALGGATLPDLGHLVDVGLVVAAPGPRDVPERFSVPAAVGSRLAALEGLARTDPIRSGEAEGATPTEARLGIAELLLAVGLQIEQGRLRRRKMESSRWLEQYVRGGWRVDAAELADVRELYKLIYRRQLVRLLPPAPSLEDADLDRLATATGRRAETIAFAVDLLVQLGVLWGADRLFLDEERLHSLLDQPGLAGLAALTREWLALDRLPELDAVLGRDGPLQLRVNLGFHGHFPVTYMAAHTRRLAARTVGRMAPGIWYDFDSFLATLFRLAPELLDGRQSDSAFYEFWTGQGELSAGRQAGEGGAHLERLRAPLVLAILTGPLQWLGLVEVASSPVGSAAFRVRAEAGVLVGRGRQADPGRELARVTVSPELDVLVGAGARDSQIHRLLARAGVLVGATDQGLRYRLMPDRVQELLDSGFPGAEMVVALAERSPSPLPEAARATLDGWLAGYGGLRLYDDLALIELADDYLLRELLATSSLRSSLIHAFSPRLIAVDSGAVEALVAEMARLGHLPRLVEQP